MHNKIGKHDIKMHNPSPTREHNADRATLAAVPRIPNELLRFFCCFLEEKEKTRKCSMYPFMELMENLRTRNTTNISIMTDSQENMMGNSYAPPFSLSSLTKSEVIKSAANRMLHSQPYKIFYILLALTSGIGLIVSLSTSCPPSWFYFVEGLVVCCMILECILRVSILLNFTIRYSF